MPAAELPAELATVKVELAGVLGGNYCHGCLAV